MCAILCSAQTPKPKRINKTIEGIYFICAKCMKVCHSLDEGLQEDPGNTNNLCSKCAKAKPAAA